MVLIVTMKKRRVPVVKRMMMWHLCLTPGTGASLVD
jgi:hypothetical protein